MFPYPDHWLTNRVKLQLCVCSFKKKLQIFHKFPVILPFIFPWVFHSPMRAVSPPLFHPVSRTTLNSTPFAILFKISLHNFSKSWMTLYKAISTVACDLFPYKYDHNFAFLKHRNAREGKWFESFLEWHNYGKAGNEAGCRQKRISA